MSFPKYPAYKDSGVEWIGEIPVGWSIKPFWTLFRRVKRNDHAEKELLSVYRDYGVIPKSSRDDNFNKPSDDLTAYQLVEKNDLVINKMKAWQGSCAVSDFEGIVSPAYFVFLSKSNNFGKFLHYLFRCDLYTSYYYSISKGVRPNQWDLDPETHSRMAVILPPLPEQQAIASFLDRECGKIDTLIAEQERLIALLAEKRQAVISHAVTKGLNPNAPMKDSGIPWIGMVPEGWEVIRLSLLSDRISSGTTPDTDNESFYEGDICWVTTGELKEAAIKNTTKKVTNLALETFSALQIYPPDTLLLAMYGATVGRIAWLETYATTNQACCALVFSKKIKMKFAFYTLLAAKKSLLLLSSGGGQPNINQEKVRSFRVPVPSSSEQSKIIEFLDFNVRDLDCLSAKIEEAITLLKERRAALISAAVTGKIDVRAQSKALAA